MSNTEKLVFYKLTENATTPFKATNNSAGYDLHSAKDIIIPPMDKALVYTDIQIRLPDGCYGRIAPRSGLAIKNFIDIGAGVIDPDYTGNIGVIMFNFGQTAFKIDKGDRIAQLICERIYQPEIEQIHQPITTTDRGPKGFGSSGSK